VSTIQCPGVKVIVQRQNGDDYRGSITWMLNLNKGYAKHNPTISETGKERVEGVEKDANSRRASSETRTLLDRLVYGMYLGVIVGTVDDFIYPYNAVKDDRHHRITLTLEPMQDDV